MDEATVDTATSTRVSRYMDSVLASKTASHIMMLLIIFIIATIVIGGALVDTYPFRPATAQPAAA